MALTDVESGTRTVTIDCFPESLSRYQTGHAVVAVDVIRATTTAVTAVVGGWRCFPASSIEAAVELARGWEDALLVGELGGHTPYGFHLTNSPVEFAAPQTGGGRPIILLSTSGTRLLCEASQDVAVYAACLRNVTAQAETLVARHRKVAIVGAGARGEFRVEDQMACAWIAGLLVDAGYEPLGRTAEIIRRWKAAPVETIVQGNSAAFLRRTDQVRDLEYVLSHLDDVHTSFEMRGEELVSELTKDRSLSSARCSDVS
jgi:2-phosphosulfolactate phosphatase